MSNFEEVACKGLGIILIILLSFLSVQLMGCTTIGWTDSGAPIVRSSSSFPLLDNRGILHEYRDNKAYPMITKPTHMSVIQVYCGVHRQWETLRIVWKRSGLFTIGHREETDYWRWTYIVNRAKKQ